MLDPQKGRKFLFVLLLIAIQLFDRDPFFQFPNKENEAERSE